MKEKILETHEVADNAEFQVDDDISLLDLMVADMAASGALYQPTKYWKGYTLEAIELLRNEGLWNFRRSEERILSSFGCLDTAPKLQFSELLSNTQGGDENTRRFLAPFAKFSNSVLLSSRKCFILSLSNSTSTRFPFI